MDAELAAAKEHLQSLQTDLDILQRTHTLDEQMYLGKPEHEKGRGRRRKNEIRRRADRGEATRSR